MLIQYTDNHTDYESRPHGNSVYNSRDHIRTCPSVMNQITSNIQDDNISTYQKMVTNDCPNNLQGVLKPKNLRQVQNLKHLHRQKTKLTHDNYYNLLLLAHELDEFMLEIITFPDHTCFSLETQIY